MSKLPGYEASAYRDHGADYRDGQDMESKDMPLYALQDKVERLPVPELKQTIDLYLSSVEPVCTPQEFKRTKELSEKFINSVGPVLQKRLLQRKADRYDSSWFAEWWNEAGYLGYRDTIVYNVSYYLQFKDELPFAMDQCRRAARFIYHSAHFWQQTINGTLAPDMKSKTQPRSNTQWKFVFNTCRIPQPGSDIVRTYAGDVFTHIVVLRKNHFFKLDLFQNGRILNTDALECQLNRIKKIADQLGSDANSIGVLSSDDRDIWTTNRESLLKNDSNKEAMTIIESAVFAVCLDDSSPVSREEIALSLLLSKGQTKNRFWDKSFQVVFFENGRGGYVGEHAMSDGLTTTRFVNETLAKLFLDEDAMKVANGQLVPYVNSAVLEEPGRISFEIEAAMSVEIQNSEARLKQMISEKELKVLMFHGFGKNKIKTFKCSPDAFVQVAIQLAYYKTFGVCAPTYESTQTRNFLHGRTEVTRSCSKAALEFSRHVVEYSSADFKRKAFELMMKAISAHSIYTKKASNAMGCDRHLMGLKLSLKSGEDDSFFCDPVYGRSGTWIMSTSGLVGELMDGWGFGEVTPQGLGIGYSVQQDRLRFTVTSRHKWADRYLANLEASLLQMEYLALRHSPAAKL